MWKRALTRPFEVEFVICCSVLALLIGFSLQTHACVSSGVKAEGSESPSTPEEAAVLVWKCWQVSAKLCVILRTQSLFDTFSQIEMPVLKVLAEAEWNGVGCDRAMITRHCKDMQERLSYLEAVAHGG